MYCSRLQPSWTVVGPTYILVHTWRLGGWQWCLVCTSIYMCVYWFSRSAIPHVQHELIRSTYYVCTTCTSTFVHTKLAARSLQVLGAKSSETQNVRVRHTIYNTKTCSQILCSSRPSAELCGHASARRIHTVYLRVRFAPSICIVIQY